MTPRYDMERLKVTCDDCLEALGNMRRHEGACAEWIRWRLAHLQRELHSFVTVFWPKPKQQETQRQ